MNYLQLINKCLVELNYKQVNSFTELTKNDHKKIMNIINVLNAEICSFDKWHFLLRKKDLKLAKHTSEISNSINGRIYTVIIDNIKLDYFEDFEKFFMKSQPSNTYSVFNNKILLPSYDEDKTVEIIYYTNMYAVDEQGAEKSALEDDLDKSVIPDVFAEPLLVYGTCMRLKGNPQHVRFNYWYGMYKDALANLRAKISINVDASPSIRLFRG